MYVSENVCTCRLPAQTARCWWSRTAEPCSGCRQLPSSRHPGVTASGAPIPAQAESQGLNVPEKGLLLEAESGYADVDLKNPGVVSGKANSPADSAGNGVRMMHVHLNVLVQLLHLKCVELCKCCHTFSTLED